MNWNLIRSGKIKLHLSDLLFTREKSAFGKAIRWATTGNGEKPSLVNHVAGITGVKNDCLSIRYEITEALSRVKTHDLFDYDNGEDEVIIIRSIGISPAALWYVAQTVLDSEGEIYSTIRILGQFTDCMANKILPQSFQISFFDRISIPFSKICSVLWSVPLSHIGLKFGAKSPYGLDPDEMLDYCLTHPEEFEVIFVTDLMEKLMKKQR